MNSNDLREKLIIPAVVGALYAALTMLLAPISYGNLQFRISEALCVLPVFFPYTSVGLFLGCALANMISAAGILDVVFGSLATLCAGLCAAACGREARRTGAMPSAAMRVLACLSPVVWNGVVIGAVLAWSFARDAFWQSFLLFGAEVALGEAGVLFLLGMPLISLIPRIFHLERKNAARNRCASFTPSGEARPAPTPSAPRAPAVSSARNTRTPTGMRSRSSARSP